jgi:hypothetical protein
VRVNAAIRIVRVKLTRRQRQYIVVAYQSLRRGDDAFDTKAAGLRAGLSRADVSALVDELSKSDPPILTGSSLAARRFTSAGEQLALDLIRNAETWRRVWKVALIVGIGAWAIISGVLITYLDRRIQRLERQAESRAVE